MSPPVKNVPARVRVPVEELPIFVTPAPAAVLPIPPRVIVPLWLVSALLIVRVPIALLAPIAPVTDIAPPSASSIKLDADPLLSSSMLEVKVISPSCVPLALAVTSISTSAVNIAGPVMVTSLLETFLVLILPPSLTAVAALRATDSISPAEPIVPPIAIVPPVVPLLAPAVIVTVSLLVASTPMMSPATVIVSLDVVATRSKSPVIFSPSPAVPP